ncbi:MAG: tRNA (guanosine(37)-N1)-methyltransferase TrmD [Verrucomicrobia bacterium]|jgi:tRNA (guanine37-N1)-methyltransferase|nr:tRNA (guanosine(37)-N1)-methyltransferase TrmD [Verrucomicrobiota bacterium]MBT7067269.1 tRNA (guanosine(37)-N1)-methyltransferase TrmD [Verrucomicrobiota bacterium]MBT7698667.1 tRNA (guanosine(37)-N1)-methyltransferase TrmD [Verrucomicrobiota bacterium]
MSEPLEIDVITIFPGMLKGFLEESMLGRATANGLAVFRTIDPRDFTEDVHRSTDDRPYGGGPGMVMTPGPLFRAVESVKRPESRVILMTPQGAPFAQRRAQDLSRERHLIFVCGHYEGVDERVRECLVTDEISIGDYVLTNGALAATVVIDAVVRLVPGVLGGEGATEEESFSQDLLEYPQYTRPAVFRGMEVPAILMSGHHAEVARWRQEQAVQRTQLRRPDLIASRTIETEDH